MEVLAISRGMTMMPDDITSLAFDIHMDNILAGWWKKHPKSGVTVPRNIGELLCLVHSEISEADTGLLDSLSDDKLPHRLMFEVELADVSIRVLDIIGYYKPNITEAELIGYPLFPVEFVGATEPSNNQLLAAMHRRTSASMEHFRKGREHDGCVELCLLLQLVNWAAYRNDLDLMGAIEEKRAFIRNRADHNPENRAKTGGKAF